MAITDEEKLELIERQLTEIVTEKVKNNLIKTYSTIGVIVGGIITVTGWGITQHIENLVIAELKSNISGKIDIINETMTQAEISAKMANKLNEETERTIDATNKELQKFNRAKNELYANLEQVEKAKAQIEKLKK